MVHGQVEAFLEGRLGADLEGKVDLILTSPPFPLNRKKAYGNKTGKEYLDWLRTIAPRLRELLSATGSLVIELGNAWDEGKPTMSTLPLEALLAIKEAGPFELCQQFICYNTARLPSPAEWVTVRRIRVKDAYTHVWWFAKTATPKADNRRVLQAYSPAMKKLLASQSYNAGTRPSEHQIGTDSFLTDNGGAIPPNVLPFANTASNDPYLAYCKEFNLKPHPARMPVELAEFFVRFLTDEGDVVFDPFGGSNTTGAVAERLGRKWTAVEADAEYIRSSVGRFLLRERRIVKSELLAPDAH